MISPRFHQAASATVMSMVIGSWAPVYSRMGRTEYPNIDRGVRRNGLQGATAQVIEAQSPSRWKIPCRHRSSRPSSPTAGRVSQITITFLTTRSRRRRGRCPRPRCPDPQAAAGDDRRTGRIKIEAMHRPSSDRVASDRHRRWRSPICRPLPDDPLKLARLIVIIGGERKYAMRVWLDRERLAAQGLTVQERNALITRTRSPGGASRARSAIHRQRAPPALAGRFNNMSSRRTAIRSSEGRRHALPAVRARKSCASAE